MIDYVNRTKPTAFQSWLSRNGDKLQAAAFILVIAIVGSLGV